MCVAAHCHRGRPRVSFLCALRAAIIRPMDPSRRRFLYASAVGFSGLILGCRGHDLPEYVPPPRNFPPPPIADEVRLPLVGDWGSGQVEHWDVARACDAAAEDAGGFHGGVFLGDNFYPAGVSGLGDSLWVDYFENVYDTPHLGGLTWQAVLGNHDYSGDPKAQIRYSEHSNGRWSMPWYYFRKDYHDDRGEPLLTVLAIDTNKRFEHRGRQLEWLADILDDLSDAEWPVIAIGHHPMWSNGRHDAPREIRETILPMLLESNVRAYFAGHDHNLQLIERPGLTQVVSGGGGKVLHGFTHQEEGTRFRKVDYGFCVLHARRDSLRVELIDRHAGILYKQAIA